MFFLFVSIFHVGFFLIETPDKDIWGENKSENNEYSIFYWESRPLLTFVDCNAKIGLLQDSISIILLYFIFLMKISSAIW